MIYGSGAADTEQKRLGARLGGDQFFEAEGGFGCGEHPRFQWVPAQLTESGGTCKSAAAKGELLMQP